MKDRVSTKILENGAIRYGIYDEAGNLLRYEYIRPEDEPTQEGDPLNKANLLPDAVATALGLTGNPQVADALNKLGDLYLYWWRKYKPEHYVINIGNYTSLIILRQDGTNTYGPNIQYSPDIIVDRNNAVSLKNPSTANAISYNSYTNANVLKGNYFINPLDDLIYLCGYSDAIRDYFGYYNYVSISAAPITGTYIPEQSFGYVSSMNPSAYADIQNPDGYWYKVLGQPFVNAREGAKITIGSYTGTGTYGSDNKNSLSADFDIKIFLIVSDIGSMSYPSVYDSTYFKSSVGSNSYGGKCEWEGKIVRWFSKAGAVEQLNQSNYKYNYVLLG